MSEIIMRGPAVRATPLARRIAKAHGVSGAQVSLAWLLQRPLVASVIVGGRTTAQFEDNLKAANLKLTADEIARLDQISQPDLIYPYWHQSFGASSRMSEPDLALHLPYIGKELGLPRVDKA
jgi:diketogulonate reductase-like aldo/keto reductase